MTGPTRRTNVALEPTRGGRAALAEEPSPGRTGGDPGTRPDRGADHRPGDADNDPDERVRGHRARVAGAYARLARDPAALAPGERLTELAGILAAGYRRMLLSRQKALAEGGGAERPCDLVDSPENEDAPEVA